MTRKPKQPGKTGKSGKAGTPRPASPSPGRPAGPSAGGTLAHMVPGAAPPASSSAPSAASPADTARARRLASEGQRALAQGDLRAAEGRFRQALTTDPRCAAALGGLGVIAARTGHMEPAARLFAQGAALEPHVPDHGLNAGSALWHLGRHRDALVVLADTAHRAPRDPRTRIAHGKALMETGDTAGAIKEARAALALAADDGQALALHGRALLRHGRPAEALPVLEAARDKAPKDPAVWNDLALTLSGLGRAAEALAAQRTAVDLSGDGPGHVDRVVTLAGMLIGDQRADEAEALLAPLRDRAPDHAGVSLTLGDALQRQGRFDEARAAYRTALEREPGNVIALRGLVKSGKVAAGDPALDALRRAAATVTDRGTRTEALFALGKALDDAGGDPAEVFTALSEANSLQRRGRPDDIPRRDALVERSREVFTPELFESLAPLGHDSERPVFIVGLPRSGTSLVEQMIASHPAVVGAGELGLWPAIQAEVPAYPDGVATMSQDAASGAAGQVLAALDDAAGRAGKPDAARVSDKLPDNAMRLGLIALLFPKARVIVCRRDPMDTALSLFQQNFADGVPYANGLETIGQAILQHARIMAHWRVVLPAWMLEVDYETLVTDLEGEGRRLIDFLGLPWDDAVLRFHETERAVYTASKWQVRQPVFTGSVGRWRRYAEHLAPVRAMLEEAGLLDRPV
ncbi:sulfotransferase [uncultured Rhodospira sp.]|uniref:sulfotransferase n=1 Tax=uncultured Rhodospira sp. TaxID=1936189 RepID=UPI002624B724|nr:tetratricopeptide repeat-containing sulfotransferase family protein [uncultured Rhodospira sp.]